MTAHVNHPHTAKVAALVGTSLLAGCALPRWTELTSRKGIDDSIPTIVKRDRLLEASPGVRPFHSRLAVSPHDIEHALGDIKQFRLEHLASISLGPACMELMRNGNAKLSIRLGETSTASVDGKYRITTVEIAPDRWERAIEISGAGFLKGEAFIRLCETDSLDPEGRPSYTVDARFSPYFPVSLALSGMTTGGPVPVYFRDRKTVRTDSVWAYSLLGSGAVLEDQFTKVRGALKQLDRTASVSLGRWNLAEPALPPEVVQSLVDSVLHENRCSYIGFRSTDSSEQSQTRERAHSLRVVGVDSDFVYVTVPSWERLVRSERLISVNQEHGIYAIPVDCTWSAAFEGTYQRHPVDYIGVSGRPLYKTTRGAVPDKILTAIGEIDPHLHNIESDFGLPVGYHEVSVSPTVRPLLEQVATTGRYGGLSTLVIGADRADEIGAEPRLILAQACKTIIWSITGAEVPGVNYPLSPEDSRVESEKIWPKLSPVLREANSMAAQVLLSLYDETARLELLGLPRQDRIAFSGYAVRLKDFLNKSSLSKHSEVSEKLDQFSEEMQQVVTGHESTARAQLGDLKKLLLDINARSQRAIDAVDPSKSKRGLDPLVTDGIGWAFVSLCKFVEIECAQQILSSSMKERLSQEVELLRKRGVVFGPNEGDEAVLYALFSAGGVPIKVTEKLTSHWGSISVPEYFLHFINQTPLARMELGSVVNSVLSTGRVWSDYSTPTSPARVFVSSPKNPRPEMLYIDPSDPLGDSAIQGMKMTGDYLERTEYFSSLKEDIRKELVKLLADQKR